MDLRGFRASIAPLLSPQHKRSVTQSAYAAGFQEVHLELRVDILPAANQPGRSWHGFMGSSPNPHAPTVEQVIRESLVPADADRFLDYLRPLVEDTSPSDQCALVYLWATKHVPPSEERSSQSA